MNATNLSLLLVFAVAAGVCFLLAYLIGVRRRLTLIAGYDARRVTDPDGLARFVARCLTAVGVAVLLLPVALLALPVAEVVIMGSFLALLLGITLYMVARASRYTGSVQR